MYFYLLNHCSFYASSFNISIFVLGAISFDPSPCYCQKLDSVIHFMYFEHLDKKWYTIDYCFQIWSFSKTEFSFIYLASVNQIQILELAEYSLFHLTVGTLLEYYNEEAVFVVCIRASTTPHLTNTTPSIFPLFPQEGNFEKFCYFMIQCLLLCTGTVSFSYSIVSNFVITFFCKFVKMLNFS